jgi:23S rRNA (pseudouridine1915-N3)-methyltransferase
VQLTIIAVGKVGEPFLEEGFDRYAQRIRRYVSLNLVWVPEERIAEKRHKEYIRQKEDQRIRRKIPPQAMIIGLDERGKSFSSEELAQTMGKWMESGRSHIAFLIGGPFGLSETLKKEAYLLSLSPLTLTHGMARLFLLEQIYRVFTIIRGEPYHK